MAIVNGLAIRRFYALVWKDFVVHKRHYIWTMLEVTIPVVVCAMAILSNSHQGRARLENERVFDPDDYERLYGDLDHNRHRLLIAPNTTFTRALVNQIDEPNLQIELCNSERDLVELIKLEIPVSLDQIKRLLPDNTSNVTIGGVVIKSDHDYVMQAAAAATNHSQTQRSTTPQAQHDDSHASHQNHNHRDHVDNNHRDRDNNISNLINDHRNQYYEVTSKLENKPMNIPIHLDMAIRAKDFRLGAEPFPKKYSLGPFIHSDHYASTFFMASQIMVSRAYINLLSQYVNTTGSVNGTGSSVIPGNEDIIGQRMPYPKFVTHRRLKDSTLGTFVAGSQKQKPFVLTMDYCITVGFLVTAIFLAKRIVDEKKSRVRDMLRLVGISDWTYYGSHICNTMILMVAQSVVITLLFTEHHEAPAQNVQPTLLLFIMIVYCFASIMFVMTLSTMFKSSTKAIIFTALAWFGMPEVLGRMFKLNAGVLESSGSVIVDEPVHLAFCLLPNFALRLVNSLLTECDIYGEFYDKKQLYGEFRAIWPNLFSVLPLYKTISLGLVLLAMLVSIPMYALLIYLINSLTSSHLGLASLSSEADEGSSGKNSRSLFLRLPRLLIRFTLGLVVTPFKLIYQLVPGSAYKSEQAAEEQERRRQHQQRLQQQQSSNSNRPDLFNLSGSLSDKTMKNNPASFSNPGFAYNPHDMDTTTTYATSNNPQNHKDQNLELKNYPQGGYKAKSSVMLNASNLNNDNNSPGADSQGMDDQSKYFEQSPGLLTVGISIRNLCKTYFTNSSKLKRIDAVRNVSLDMFYSQILVLLGHNGAGKTTLIDIISGHTDKSSGQVYIDGHSIDTEPREARSRVGFCPQFDVLFERLTVFEHLYFYGIIKGAKSELSNEIEQLLSQSGLDVHRNKLSKTLSGGYKRKLSLAIAMIAKSKVLILDEPTSGMDPESRRKVWDFLQLIRRDRLILMTTHHMEEADALGDRIAVMSSGQVRCCGSALFLKRIFNAGYHLRISKADNWNQTAFDELIGSKYRLDDKLKNMTPHELMFSFDTNDTSTMLPSLFGDLEALRERVGIFGFGITVSTMDDVFMKIGLHFNDVEAQEMQSKFELTKLAAQKKSANGNGNGTGNGNGHGKMPFVTSPNHKKANLIENSAMMLGGCKSNRLEGSSLLRQHMRALIMKRAHHARKNWFQLVWIMGISLACVASIVILLDLVIFREELTPEWSRSMTLEGVGYGRHTVGVYQFAEPKGDSEDDEFLALRDLAFGKNDDASATTTTGTSPAPMTMQEANSTATQATSSSTTPGVPVPSEPSTSTTAAAPTTTVSMTTTTTSGNSAAEVPKTQTAAFRSELARPRRRTRRQAEVKTNISKEFLDGYWLPEAKASGLGDLLTYSDINSQMVDLLTRQFANFREHYIIGGERTEKKYIAWYSGEASHSFPISMNIMLNSILKQTTDLIQDNGHPLKRSHISLTHTAMAQINTLIAFLPHLGRLINLVFLPFALAFITSYFVMFPTHERESRSKHLQLMTGVPARVFWLSHFLFDLAFYAAYTILVLAIYYIWDRVINDRRIYFANFEHSVALIALVTLYIFGALPLAYIFSFLAKKPTSAFSAFCVLTILTGTSTLTLVSLYELKYEDSASGAFKLAFSMFLWGSRLIPSVSLLIGLQKLFALNTTRSICINVSPEVLEILCRYINSPLVDEELRVLKPERCCKQYCGNECFDQWPFHWAGWFGVNIELVMLVVDALLLWFVLVCIESRAVRDRVFGVWSSIGSRVGSMTHKVGRPISGLRRYEWRVPQFDLRVGVAHKGRFDAPAHGDEKVREENMRSLNAVNMVQTDQYSLVANQLTKVYSRNKFTAVDGLSFVVDKREFFGLLGVNGAGKSTTFKMLTGEIRPSAGNSYVGPYDVQNNRRQYLKRIGYCPQQDALVDSLTGAEMLELFARLRGLPERYIEGAVECTLERLGLNRIAQIDCNKYSGGNKRRLSVGMALIGAPEVIFLDEPTSGVDPRSRRRLWSTLIEYQEAAKSAIVMTSHSMNECECLCDRVAIMVAGQFKVLGSIQYLRTKLSQGFSLILKLKPQHLATRAELGNSSRRINDYMESIFGPQNLELNDSHQTVLQYHIKPTDELTWSAMLIKLEQAKQQLDLEDYQITSDASLESIFLSLAKTK